MVKGIKLLKKLKKLLFLTISIIFLNLTVNSDSLLADVDQPRFTAPATTSPKSILQPTFTPRAGSPHWSQVPSKDGWTLVATGTTELRSKVESEKIYLGKNSLNQDTYFCYSSDTGMNTTFFPYVYLMVGNSIVNPLCRNDGSHGYVGAANGTIPEVVNQFPYPQNLTYYKKKATNGLNSYWLSYDSRVLDETSGHYFHVDIIMEGRLTGGVVINYYLTNVDNVTHQPAIDYPQFSFSGWAHVVGFGSDLKMPGYLLSDHRGLYFDSKSQNYRLNILLNGDNHPDNWKADGDFEYFKTIKETGKELTPWDPTGNHIAKDYSNSIHFKNQPIDLLPGETTSFSWEYGLIMADVPNIALDQKDQELYNNQDYQVSGYWRDFKGTKADLYYQIDEQPAVKYLTINNPVKGNDVAWQYLIPKAAFKGLYGQHTITIWGISDNNQKSNLPKVLLNFLRPKLNVKYVVKKADGSMVDLPGATAATQEGAFGETFNITLRSDLDGYEFSWDDTRAANSTISGLAFNPSTKIVSGTYQDATQTLTLVYLAGRLELKAPITIDLGRKILNEGTNYWPIMNQGSATTKLEVVDKRSQTEKSNWSVTAKLITATNPGTGTEMPDGMLIFKKSGIEQALSKTSSVNILTKSAATHPVGTEITPISDTWDQNNGIFVKAERTKVQKSRYVAAIEWTCVQATP